MAINRALGRLGMAGMAVSVLSVAAGCSVERGFAAREWAQTVREYNITPVFPLREDVQIGDIFLLPDSPDELDRKVAAGDGFLAITTLHDSVDLSAWIKAHQDRRFSFPRIGGSRDFGSTTDSSLVKVPACSGADCNAFAVRDASRLRQVAFPDLELATFTGVEAQAIVPTAAFAGAAGFAYEAVDRVTLKVPAAESYGVPAAVVVNRLFQRIPDTTHVVACFDVTGAAQMARALRPEATAAFLRIPTEIYLARAIDMEIKLSRSTGVGLNVAMPMPDGRERQALDALLAELTAGEKPDEPPEPALNLLSQPADPSKEEAVPRSDVPADIVAKAAELKGMLKIQGSGPGAGLRVLNVSQGSVTLRRTFERPLVIGFRGVDAAIDVTKLQGVRLKEKHAGTDKPVPTISEIKVTSSSEKADPIECGVPQSGVYGIIPAEAVAVVGTGATGGGFQPQFVDRHAAQPGT